MIQTINLHEFRNAFQAAGRGEQFTYKGLEVLFDYLEQLEYHTGSSIDLDVIGLCCDYAESTPEEIARDYDIEIDGLDLADAFKPVIEHLEEQTSICGTTDDTIIYLQF
jgi:hypothetical protein